MGNINNSVWATRRGSFNCTRCENDVPFMMPILQGDDLFLQLPISKWFPGYTLGSVDLIDLADGVLLPDIFAPPGTYGTDTFGPGYYALIDGRLIIKVPPVACEVFTVENVGKCMISLEDVYFDQRFATWYNSGLPGGSLVLYYNGATYNIYQNELPAGAQWLGGLYRQFLQLPCEIANSPTAHFEGSYVNDLGVYTTFTTALSTTPCLREICDTFYTVTEEDYLAIDKAVIEGVTYQVGPGVSLWGTGMFIPYITPSSTHTPAPGNMVKIPSRFDVDIEFYKGGVLVEKTYNSINCKTCYATKRISCFALAVNLIPVQQGEPFTVYSEPFECNECEPSVLIESDYGGRPDCMGNIYTFPPNKDGGLLAEYKNTLRIPAVVRNLPSKFSATINDKCHIYKSEITETAEIQGTKAFPRYFARMVENVAAGRRFWADGVQYLIRGERIFEPFTAPATSTETLNLHVEKCVCEVYFDCV